MEKVKVSYLYSSFYSEVIIQFQRVSHSPFTHLQTGSAIVVINIESDMWMRACLWQQNMSRIEDIIPDCEFAPVRGGICRGCGTYGYFET